MITIKEKEYIEMWKERELYRNALLAMLEHSISSPEWFYRRAEETLKEAKEKASPERVKEMHGGETWRSGGSE